MNMRGLILLLMLFLLSANLHAQPAAQEPVLTFGRGEIVSAAWSPDGQSIWISTTAGTWQLDTTLREIAAYPHITYVTVSPDETKLAGISTDGYFVVWDIPTSQEIWRDGFDPVTDIPQLAWTPNSRQLAIVREYSLDILSLDDLRTQYLFGGRSFSPAWSESGKYLAINTADSGLRIIDMQTKEPIPLQSGSQRVGQLKWYGDDELVGFELGVDSPSFHRRWRIADGTYSFEQLGACTGAGCAYSPDGRFLAGLGQGNSGLQVIDANSAKNIFSFEGAYANLLWAPDSRRLAIRRFYWTERGEDAVIAVDLGTRAVLWQQTQIGLRTEWLQWDATGSQLLAVGSGRVALLDGQTGEVIQRNEDFRQPDLAGMDGQGKRIAVSDTVGDMRVVDLDYGRIIAETSGRGNPNEVISWQPNGEIIAFGDIPEYPDEGGFVELWLPDYADPIETSLPVNARFIYERRLFDIEWSPSGESFAISADGYLELYGERAEVLALTYLAGNTIDTIAYMHIFWQEEPNPLVSYGLSYGGHFGITDFKAEYPIHLSGAWDISDDGTIREFNFWHSGIRDFRPTLTLTRLSEAPSKIELQVISSKFERGWMSPEATRIAAIDASGSGLIWDATTGQPLHFLADVHDLVWTPDDSTLAILRRDGSLWLQNADGLRLLWSPTIPVRTPGTLVWSGDGSTLAHTQDGVLRVWRP